uniref:Tyrosinase_Cu-bd domain-containing protein n=1 Tax=Steinernema glaseri TaxID=37863 RepID=A0A1I7Y3B1_9BILA
MRRKRGDYTLLLIAVNVLIGVTYAKMYSLEFKEMLNGKEYHTKHVQPFFKVYHESHHKLQVLMPHEKTKSLRGPIFKAADDPPQHGQAPQKKKSFFGVHFLPLLDIKSYLEPKWPRPFDKYAHCMDIPCSCPYYDGWLRYPATRHCLFSRLGIVVNGSCVLPSGKILGKALRKDFRMYTPDEKRKFEEALNTMKRSGLYNEIGKMHKYGGVHSGPAFLPWHRELIK